ncbi:hypothetical protein HUA74_18405 [Myxococcus sp. CA051A]|uniref:Uncharacterized protein n=1 Tax=Myxococcus llanfairpwllgwyngyllgogerychwyrndrobwllllantysiliogogogochensis TaxID=2590453 RepID=A0A540X7Q7_9BACT|nr:MULTISPECIES: hypothetical protein [Myxococcus]NTX62627.1 hypothetical protein [Myxococcus sp. CA051A]TQF17232.1 hypothetical protein FJV41_04100 [Myxococcus llanfairpwllgwyngyllgogerychwyrndrobwllllantysiliogogogochensis]
MSRKPLDPSLVILPGGKVTRWGGRCPETTCEQHYAVAIAHHATKRQQMVAAATAEGEARKAYVAAIAEHGPCSSSANTARMRWDAARVLTLAGAAKLEAASLRVMRAADAWAAEVASQLYSREPVAPAPPEPLARTWAEYMDGDAL